MSILNYNFRRAVTACAMCTAAVFGLQAQPALAVGVDEMAFELDGNLISDTNGKVDWKDLFNTANSPPTVADPLPANFGRAAFFRDFDPNSNKDNSTYTTGSKDTLNITPGWQCVVANNVTDKIDVLNAYAAAYTDPTSGDVVLYFAQEVASNEGTKDLGFWFLKDPTVGCVAGNKASDYTGKHSNGDILIVAEYTNGGGVSVIRAYKWVKDPGDPVGFLETTPFVESGSCNGAGHGTSLCAVINDKALLAPTDVPWLTKTKTSNPVDKNYTGSKDLDVGEFFEGGLNLTANKIEGCFTRYLADTRSSTSLTATLFDYVLGEFSICKITVNKTCQTASVDPSDRASFLSPFNIAVKNDGIAQVFDIKIKDTIPSGTGISESCNVVSIDGTVLQTPIAITSGTPVAVGVDTLAKNTTVNIGISCDGNLNSFDNIVQAIAGSADGGTDLTADDNITDTERNACKASPVGSLSVDKVCNGITLVNNNGLVGLGVKVAVTVANNGTGAGAELVENIVVQDNKVQGGTPTGNLATKAVNCITREATTFSGSLLPGQTACFDATYTPALADLVNPPSTASFTDMVTVNGTGKLSQQAVPTQTDTATCFLCDFDLDGKPDVTDFKPNDPTVQDPPTTP